MTWKGEKEQFLKNLCLSPVYFSCQTSVLAEVVNHPWLLFEMPNAPCAFFFLPFYFYFFFHFQREEEQPVPLLCLGWGTFSAPDSSSRALPFPATPDASELSQNSLPCLAFVIIMGEIKIKNTPWNFHSHNPVPNPWCPQVGAQGGSQHHRYYLFLAFKEL